MASTSSYCPRLRKLTLNSLWSIWYCIFAFTITVYLAKNNFAKYRQNVTLEWIQNAYPNVELQMFICLTVLALILSPFLLVTSAFLCGNLANDGKKLGRNVTMMAGSKRSTWKMLWMYCPPVSPLLHVFISFCFLMARLLMDASLIKHGFLKLGTIWVTDIDHLFNDDVGDTYNYSASARTQKNPQLVTSVDVMGASLEFANFGFALLVLGVRYPAVFWFTNKVFSMLFSGYAILSTIYQMISFSGFCIMYKIQAYGVRSIIDDRQLILGAGATTLLYFCGSILVFLSPVLIFWHGILKYGHNLTLERERLSVVNETRSRHGYMPHLMAMAMLVLATACKGPLVYDNLVVYSKIPSYVIGVSIICDICYLLLWIIFWFVLTIRRNWKFHIEFAEMPKKSPNSLISGKSIEKTNLLGSDSPDLRDPEKRSLLGMLQIGKDNSESWKNSLKRAARGSISSTKKNLVTMSEDESDRQSSQNSDRCNSRGIYISGPIQSVFDTVPLAPIPKDYNVLPTMQDMTSIPRMKQLATCKENEEDSAVSNFLNDMTFCRPMDIKYMSLDRLYNMNHPKYKQEESMTRKLLQNHCYQMDEDPGHHCYRSLRHGQRRSVPHYSRRSQTFNGNRKSRPSLPTMLKMGIDLPRTPSPYQNNCYLATQNASALGRKLRNTQDEVQTSEGYERRVNSNMTSFTDQPDFLIDDSINYPKSPDPDYTEIAEQVEEDGEESAEDEETAANEDDMDAEENEKPSPSFSRGRRDSANYSLTDSNGNESDHYGYGNVHLRDVDNYCHPGVIRKTSPSDSSGNCTLNDNES